MPSPAVSLRQPTAAPSKKAPPNVPAAVSALSQASKKTTTTTATAAAAAAASAAAHNTAPLAAGGLTCIISFLACNGVQQGHRTAGQQQQVNANAAGGATPAATAAFVSADALFSSAVQAPSLADAANAVSLSTAPIPTAVTRPLALLAASPHCRRALERYLTCGCVFAPLGSLILQVQRRDPSAAALFWSSPARTRSAQARHESPSFNSCSNSLSAGAGGDATQQLVVTSTNIPTVVLPFRTPSRSSRSPSRSPVLRPHSATSVLLPPRQAFAGSPLPSPAGAIAAVPTREVLSQMPPPAAVRSGRSPVESERLSLLRRTPSPQETSLPVPTATAGTAAGAPVTEAVLPASLSPVLQSRRLPVGGGGVAAAATAAVGTPVSAPTAASSAPALRSSLPTVSTTHAPIRPLSGPLRAATAGTVGAASRGTTGGGSGGGLPRQRTGAGSPAGASAASYGVATTPPLRPTYPASASLSFTVRTPPAPLPPAPFPHPRLSPRGAALSRPSTPPAQALPPLPSAALQTLCHALWWVRRGPLPVSLSLLRYQEEDLHALWELLRDDGAVRGSSEGAVAAAAAPPHGASTNDTVPSTLQSWSQVSDSDGRGRSSAALVTPRTLFPPLPGKMSGAAAAIAATAAAAAFNASLMRAASPASTGGGDTTFSFTSSPTMTSSNVATSAANGQSSVVPPPPPLSLRSAVTELHVHGRAADTALTTLLPGHPEVRSLRLTHAALSDAQLRDLARYCPDVTHLSLAMNSQIQTTAFLCPPSPSEVSSVTTNNTATTVATTTVFSASQLYNSVSPSAHLPLSTPPPQHQQQQPPPPHQPTTPPLPAPPSQQLYSRASPRMSFDGRAPQEEPHPQQQVSSSAFSRTRRVGPTGSHGPVLHGLTSPRDLTDSSVDGDHGGSASGRWGVLSDDVDPLADSRRTQLPPPSSPAGAAAATAARAPPQPRPHNVPVDAHPSPSLDHLEHNNSQLDLFAAEEEGEAEMRLSLWQAAQTDAAERRQAVFILRPYDVVLGDADHAVDSSGGGGHGARVPHSPDPAGALESGDEVRMVDSDAENPSVDGSDINVPRSRQQQQSIGASSKPQPHATVHTPAEAATGNDTDASLPPGSGQRKELPFDGKDRRRSGGTSGPDGCRTESNVHTAAALPISSCLSSSFTAEAAGGGGAGGGSSIAGPAGAGDAMSTVTAAFTSIVGGATAPPSVSGATQHADPLVRAGPAGRATGVAAGLAANASFLLELANSLRLSSGPTSPTLTAVGGGAAAGQKPHCVGSGKTTQFLRAVSGAGKEEDQLTSAKTKESRHTDRHRRDDAKSTPGTTPRTQRHRKHRHSPSSPNGSPTPPPTRRTATTNWADTLIDLDLSYTHIPDQDAARDVPRLRMLSRLSLEGCMRLIQVRWMPSLRYLRELNLSFSSLHGAALYPLGQCAQLVWLKLEGCVSFTSVEQLWNESADDAREPDVAAGGGAAPAAAGAPPPPPFAQNNDQPLQQQRQHHEQTPVEVTVAAGPLATPLMEEIRLPSPTAHPTPAAGVAAAVAPPTAGTPTHMLRHRTSGGIPAITVLPPSAAATATATPAEPADGSRTDEPPRRPEGQEEGRRGDEVHAPPLSMPLPAHLPTSPTSNATSSPTRQHASSASVSEATAASVPLLEGLRVLIASSTGLTNAGLLPLQRMEGLECVVLDRCPGITDVNVAAELPSLHTLDASRTRVNADGLAALRRSRTLRQLRLQECLALTQLPPLFVKPANSSSGTNAEGWSGLHDTLDSSPNTSSRSFTCAALALTALDLSLCNNLAANAVDGLVADELTANLRGLTGVASPAAAAAAATPDPARGVQQSEHPDARVSAPPSPAALLFPHLRHLLLRSCDAVTALTTLRSFTRVVELDLYHTNVDETQLTAALASWSCLEVLNIASTQVRSLAGWAAKEGEGRCVGVPAFASTLRVLILSNTDVTSEGLLALQRFSKLEVLQLSNCRRLTSLRFLLPCADATGDGAGLASGAGVSPSQQRPYRRTALRELTVTEAAGLTNAETFPYLASCPGLRSLSLAGCARVGSGVRAVSPASAASPTAPSSLAVTTMPALPPTGGNITTTTAATAAAPLPLPPHKSLPSLPSQVKQQRIKDAGSNSSSRDFAVLRCMLGLTDLNLSNTAVSRQDLQALLIGPKRNPRSSTAAAGGGGSAKAGESLQHHHPTSGSSAAQHLNPRLSARLNLLAMPAKTATQSDGSCSNSSNSSNSTRVSEKEDGTSAALLAASTTVGPSLQRLWLRGCRLLDEEGLLAAAVAEAQQFTQQSDEATSCMASLQEVYLSRGRFGGAVLCGLIP